MPIRLLKLRAWIKARTGQLRRYALEPIVTVTIAPEPHAFDAWVCEHCDPEELFDGLDRQALRRIQQASAASDAPDLYDPLDHATRLRIAGLL